VRSRIAFTSGLYTHAGCVFNTHGIGKTDVDEFEQVLKV